LVFFLRFIGQNQELPGYITLKLRKEATQPHASSLVPSLFADLLVARAADLFGVDLRERGSLREAVRWGLSVYRASSNQHKKRSKQIFLLDPQVSFSTSLLHEV